MVVKSIEYKQKEQQSVTWLIAVSYLLVPAKLTLNLPWQITFLIFSYANSSTPHPQQ